MSEPDIPVDVQKSEISSSLNSTILLAFLMGMYTIIYFGTIYIYFTRNSTNRRLVPATITMLFLTCMAQTATMWYTIKWEVIDNGDTRYSIFMALFGGPEWIVLAVNISSYLGVVLADALLIWRCFFVWGRSFRIIALPLALLLTETGLLVDQIVLHAIYYGQTISPALINKYNRMISAAFFISFATALTTTILIAYRIYSVMKQEGTSTRRFKHVLDIVVQSGMVYSFTQFVYAISGILPGVDNILSTRIIALQDYGAFLSISIGGMSTTILVARVCMLPLNNTFSSTSIHISGLQFHAPSTHQTDVPEDVGPTLSIAIDRNFGAEGQNVNNKAQ